ncbi:hypothetical protein CRYPA_564 [uncultured Candidatus Thioglobus sp.]|nr:hypothetical protein CRYPA_564 [uncultured Candidatus Thioglobus sp.]
MPKNQAMPWQSYVDDEHKTVVFNLTMGESRFIDAASYFGTEIEASLFEDEASEPELEVFFTGTKIGGISAKIILNLVLDNQIIDILSNNIDESMRMPSGVTKTTFTAKGERAMSHLKIRALTFIPGTNLEEAMIENLFGKPDKIELADEGVSYWHYPQKGLRIIVDAEHKEVLEFYNQ